MDEASQSGRVNFADIIRISAQFYAKIIRDPQNSDAILIELNDELSKVTHDSMKGWLIFSNEINQLTLVCSDKMLSMVDEYKELNKKNFDNYSRLLSTLSLFDPNAQTLLQQAISKTDQDRITFLYSEIKKQMRREIGNG